MKLIQHPRSRFYREIQEIKYFIDDAKLYYGREAAYEPRFKEREALTRALIRFKYLERIAKGETIEALAKDVRFNTQTLKLQLQNTILKVKLYMKLNEQKNA